MNPSIILQESTLLDNLITIFNHNHTLFNETIFLIVQHKKVDTTLLLRALITMGANPTSMFVMGKIYSDAANAEKDMNQLISEGVDWTDHSAKPEDRSFFALSFINDIHTLLRKANNYAKKVQDEQKKPKPEFNAKRIIILEDGGHVSKTLNGKLRKKRFHPEGINADTDYLYLIAYPIASVEQTTAGMRDIIEDEQQPPIDRELFFPLVHIAYTAPKNIFETEMVAEAVNQSVNVYCPEFKQEKTHKIGIIACGHIGRALVKSLYDQKKSIMVYDKDQKNALDNLTALEGAAIPKENIIVINDFNEYINYQESIDSQISLGKAVTNKIILLTPKAENLIQFLQHNDYIFGCSGKEPLKEYAEQIIAAFLQLAKSIPKANKQEKIFISCSSENKEFFTLLQIQAATYKTATHGIPNEILLDFICEFPESGLSLRICRGGYPINFSPPHYSIELRDIEIILGLLFCGVIQAFYEAERIRLSQDPEEKLGFPHKTKTRFFYLHPLFQRLCSELWLEKIRSKRSYTKEKLLPLQTWKKIQEYSLYKEKVENKDEKSSYTELWGSALHTEIANIIWQDFSRYYDRKHPVDIIRTFAFDYVAPQKQILANLPKTPEFKRLFSYYSDNFSYHQIQDFFDRNYERYYDGRLDHQELVEEKKEELNHEFVLPNHKLFECYVEPILGDDLEGSNLNSAESQTKTFLDGNTKLLVILGSPGSGKTFFAHKIEQQLWQEYKDAQNFIPIRLTMSTLETLNDPNRSLLSQILAKRNLDQGMIKTLQTNHKILLILDAYEESQLTDNIFIKKKLYAEKNLKVIITTRIDYWFKYLQPSFERYRELTIKYLQQFSDKQIKEYLNKFSQKHPNLSWENGDAYYDHIKSIPNLYDLVKTPLLLYLTASILPEISRQNPGIYEVTRSMLYEKFIQNWFERAFVRLIDHGKLHEIGSANLIEQLQRYNCQLAIALFNNPRELPLQLLNQQYFLFSSPVSSNANDSYCYIHATIQEYFIALALYCDKTNSLFSSQRFCQEHSIIHFLADRVAYDKDFKERLFGLIKKSKPQNNFQLGSGAIAQPAAAGIYVGPIESKESPKTAIAAANAITILNAAKVVFSEENFQMINVEGAYLDGAIFDRTQFQGANLSNTHLRAWLRNAILTDAILKNINCGEFPAFKFDSEIKSDCAKNGKLLLIVYSGIINLYDAESLKLIIKINDNDFHANGALFSDDSQLLIGYSHKGKIACWKIDNPEKPERLCSGDIGSVKLGIRSATTAKTRDGNRIIFGLNEGDIRSAEIVKNHIIKFPCSLYKHSTHVSNCCFNHRKNFLATTGGEGLKVFDFETGCYALILLNESFLDKDTAIESICFANNSDLLALGCTDGNIYLWDIHQNKHIGILKNQNYPIRSLAFSKNDNFLITGGNDKTICIWDLVTYKFVGSISGHTGPVINVFWDELHLRIVSESYDNSVRVWDFNSFFAANNDLARKTNICLSALACDPHPNLDLLAITNKEGLLFLLERSTGKILSKHKVCEGCIKTVKFSRNGDLLATGDNSGIINIWKLKNTYELEKKAQLILRDPHQVVFLSFESADNYIAVEYGKPVYEVEQMFMYFALWDVNKATLDLDKSEDALIHSSIGPGSTVNGIELIPRRNDEAFSINRRFRITGDCDGRIHIYDTKNQSSTILIKGLNGRILDLKWLNAQAKDYIISVSDDNSVCYWEFREQQLEVVLRWAIQPNRLVLTGAVPQNILTESLASSVPTRREDTDLRIQRIHPEEKKELPQAMPPQPQKPEKKIEGRAEHMSPRPQASVLTAANFQKAATHFFRYLKTLNNLGDYVLSDEAEAAALESLRQQERNNNPT